MPAAHECTVTLLTPSGRSAVAVLLIEGDGAERRVGQLFRPASGEPFRDAVLGRILVGYLGRDADQCGEQVVVCRRGLETIEVHCHGGRAAVAMVIEQFVGLGCRQTRWEDRAGQLEQDLVTAEARLALARVRTNRAATILLDQYNGALHGELAAIARQIESGQQAGAAAALQRLLGLACLGIHLTEPWRVVLAGPPNVGKSSLINALLGYQRAIVYEQPGTTRDAVTTLTAIDGWPVELIDTAGLRPSADEIERAGVQVARRRMAEADLVVFVSDGSLPWNTGDDELLQSVPAPLLVHNKSDLAPAANSRPAGLPTSAVTGEGIQHLITAVGTRLVPRPPPDLAALPFTERQVAILEESQAALAQGHDPQAASLPQTICAGKRVAAILE